MRSVDFSPQQIDVPVLDLKVNYAAAPPFELHRYRMKSRVPSPPSSSPHRVTRHRHLPKLGEASERPAHPRLSRRRSRECKTSPRPPSSSPLRASPRRQLARSPEAHGVGTVETRVPWAGLPRPTRFFGRFSLRTRLSEPGKAREGFSLARDLFSSPRVFSLGEGPLLDKASLTPPAILLRTKPKGSARLFASRGSFLAKPSLPPLAERTWALRPCAG